MNREIEDYLHAHIPLSNAMGVQVLEADCRRVILSAPLAPNINHRDTVFGGSASAVAILAAWTLLYVCLKQEGMQSRVVIQRNRMTYELPIAGTFNAVAIQPAAEPWKSFMNMLKKKNRSRITIASTLYYNDEVAGAFEGEFVALNVK